MDRHLRKTKIICTVGPAIDSFEALEALYHAGMDILRINMSHATHETAEKIINWIKTLNKKIPYPIAILIDTQGPEIRTGNLSNNIQLVKDQIISVTVRPEQDVELSSIQVNYADLVSNVSVGDRITFDNGLINLEVLEKFDDAGHLSCLVLDNGVLGSKRHVNLPGIKVNLPSITDKDAEDIAFAMAQEVDFIALSFVREASDIEQARDMLGDKRDKIRLIAKIEDAEAVKNQESIVQVADAIMIARGDLGVEVDIALLPQIQRQITALCAKYGKRVIVATHLLESMIQNSIPTRAEVSDVANAVYDEVDAIMLSGETSIGKYPIKCVENLVHISLETEKLGGSTFYRELILSGSKQHLAVAAVQLAESIQASSIIVITRKGTTADMVANCHPQSMPIFAITNNSQTRRLLVLNRYVYSLRIRFSISPEKTLQNAFLALKERKLVAKKTKVVVISDIIAGQGIDAIQIREIV